MAQVLVVDDTERIRGGIRTLRERAALMHRGQPFGGAGASRADAAGG
jgi:hypothetical protein